MAITRRIARPLLASMFIAGGVEALRDPGAKAKAAQAVTVPLARRFPLLPDDPELLVRVNGTVQVGAGVLLAVGRFRRLAAVALIASIVPTTYAGHRFWEEHDEATREEQQVHFLKNLGLLGGLILAATDTEGGPTLGWRARRQAARIGAAVIVGKAAGSSSAKSAAGEIGRHLDAGATRASRNAQEVAARVAREADLGRQQLADTLPAVGQQLAEVVAGAGQRAADAVARAASRSSEAVGPYLAGADDRAADLVDRVQNLFDR